LAQFTLLDPDMYMKRSFTREDPGFISSVAQEDGATPPEICKTIGAQAVFSAFLDNSCSLGLIISTGRQLDTDLVTLVKVQPTGLTELSVIHVPSGTYASSTHITVMSYPAQHHFIILQEATYDPQYQCVLYELKPSDKGVITVSCRPLLGEERKQVLAEEPRYKLTNFAGTVFQMPHPTRSFDIISEDTTDSPDLFSLGLFANEPEEEDDEDDYGEDDTGDEDEDEDEDEEDDEDEGFSDEVSGEDQDEPEYSRSSTNDLMSEIFSSMNLNTPFTAPQDSGTSAPAPAFTASPFLNATLQEVNNAMVNMESE